MEYAANSGSLPPRFDFKCGARTASEPSLASHSPPESRATAFNRFSERNLANSLLLVFFSVRFLSERRWLGRRGRADHPEFPTTLFHLAVMSHLVRAAVPNIFGMHDSPTRTSHGFQDHTQRNGRA